MSEIIKAIEMGSEKEALALAMAHEVIFGFSDTVFDALTIRLQQRYNPIDFA